MPHLASGIGPRPGLPAVADQHLVDVGRGDPGPFECGTHRHGAERGGMHVLETAPVAPDRRARGAKDHDISGRHRWR